MLQPGQWAHLLSKVVNSIEAHNPAQCVSAPSNWLRLDRVLYGNSVRDTAAIGFDDEVSYRQVTCSPQQRDIPEVRVLVDEAHAVFREYEAKPGTVRY